MRKVMIDTNIWVDVILARPAFESSSRAVLLACIEDDIDMMLPATSLKDIFYFASQSAGADAGYQALDLVGQLAAITTVDAFVCREALTRECPDYEDGIVAACALAEHAEAIVSRDRESFNDLAIPKYSPEEFMAALGYEESALS